MNYYLTRFQQGLIVAALSGGLVLNNTYATGIPTIDVANIVQTSMTALESIQQTMQMIESFETQLQQYEQQIKDYENMSGSYGMGNLLNASSDTATRRWAPANWQETLSVLKAGGIPGTNTSVNTAMTSYKNQLGIQFSNEVYGTRAGKMVRTASYYDTHVGTNLAAMSLSDAVYSTTNERTENIEALTAQIDTATDMKAAMDLNNRLVAQLLHQQNQMIQVMAIQTEAIATQNYAHANIQAANAEFSTFDPGI